MKFLCIILFSLLPIIARTQTNCTSSTFVCNTVNAIPLGIGTQDLNGSNQGCLSVEHNSRWYSITILTSGTLNFVINPNNNSNDFDFAVWSPNSSCGSLGSPIRCSFAANSGNTGLGNGATDNSETAFGDGWVKTLNVIAGQNYYILVDNYTTNLGFQLSFGGTSTLSCSMLPIELVSFDGINIGYVNQLHWITATETNNSGFDIERSIDGLNWSKIDFMVSIGNSTNMRYYIYDDKTFKNVINYYRLKQIDFNGDYTYSNIISIDNTRSCTIKVTKITNLLGQTVTESYSGTKIYFYENGVVERIN
jgi:hypothetical protein